MEERKGERIGRCRGTEVESMRGELEGKSKGKEDGE